MNMNMKKILFTALALSVCSTAVLAQTSFGIKAGPDFASITTKSNGSKHTGKILTGLMAGVYANIPLAPQFYVQPSLLYEGKGSKDAFYGADTKVRLNYLTLPVDLLFKPEMPNGSGAWIVGIGPYFGYGISGKSSGDDVSGDDPFKTEGGLKRFDAGANVQLGYEMASGFNIGLEAELGLVNLESSGNSDNSARNTSFGVTVGYTFGRRL
jgi:opacity protein-like surface antigen